MERIAKYTVNKALKLAACFAIAGILVIMLPVVSQAFSLLSNELINLNGVVDSDLWLSSGETTGIPLIGSGNLAAGSILAIRILNSMIGLIIAVGVCYMTLKLISDFNIITALLIAMEGVIAYIIATQLISLIL